jgi:hypothetical protein
MSGSPPAVALRPARDDDAEFLARLYASTRADDPALAGWSGQQRKAFVGSILRLDCAPADVLALGGEIPQLGREIPTAPTDLIATAVCRQFNQECADYDELRRDHAAVARNPTVANQGLYVHDLALFDGCRHRYG